MSRQLNRRLETLNCNVSVHCSSHWHGLTDDDGGGGGGDDDDDSGCLLPDVCYTLLKDLHTACYES